MTLVLAGVHHPTVGDVVGISYVPFTKRSVDVSTATTAEDGLTAIYYRIGRYSADNLVVAAFIHGTYNAVQFAIAYFQATGTVG